MENHEQNSRLLNMPVLVIEKILSNIPNLSKISTTCKFLYEIVCDMIKSQRAMCIRTFKPQYRSTRLTIDDDAVFDSIMNSHRTINEINLHAGCKNLELTKRQLERLTVILKQFGPNITTFQISGFVLSINSILELLQQLPKLQNLLFMHGRTVSSGTEKTSTHIQLPRLQSLVIYRHSGLLDIVNSIPAGSINMYHSENLEIHATESTDILKTILAKQHNIKHLYLLDFSDKTILNVDNLQLETLTLWGNSNTPMEILMFHRNLKEFRFSAKSHRLSASSFQWICNNLKKLEVFDVCWLNSPEGNALEMLGGLTKLRHFVTDGSHDFLINKFPLNTVERLEITHGPKFSCGQLLNRMAVSMVHSFTNIKVLRMDFDDFSAFNFALGHFTKLTHLISTIQNPIAAQLTRQHFPNIQHLNLSTDKVNGYKMSESMSLIVKAMPNLKSLIMTIKGLVFNAAMMKEFIKGSKNLDYFFVDYFKLDLKVSTKDFVETIRCLTDQLKGYDLKFDNGPCGKWYARKTIKEILANEFSVGDFYRDSSLFYLYKGGVNKFYDF